MQTLGSDTLSWVRRLLESYEKSVFTVSGSPEMIWSPPTQEALERLEFLSRLYCQFQQIVELEQTDAAGVRARLSQPAESTRRSE